MAPLATSQDSIQLTFWTKRWHLLAGAVGGLLLAIVYLMLATPRYSAEIIVLPSENADESVINSLGGSLGGLGAIAGFGTGQNSTTKEALALLQSRGFIESFIQEGDLLPMLFASLWDLDTKSWVSSEEAPSLWDGYRQFSNGILSVTNDLDLGVTIVAVSWFDPKVAADWANALIQRVNERMRRNEISEADRSLTFLRQELETTDVLEVRQGIFKLMDKQVNRIMLANVRPEFSLKILDEARPKDADSPDSPKKLFTLVAGITFGTACVLAFLLATTLIPVRPPK